ncbi:hypothetical protein PAPYR_4144 [Paratrimastix pyriformis]|uniref:Uncharacterized protein n=1 Tax=Paratrimastix pyriformis TaxID=342808 RepID=A0ABQ8UNZ9_9EUKA|nr:hypothetical protein PAPYR_4144 [Paratrimastix pyriformis]
MSQGFLKPFEKRLMCCLPGCINPIPAGDEFSGFCSRRHREISYTQGIRPISPVREQARGLVPSSKPLQSPEIWNHRASVTFFPSSPPSGSCAGGRPCRYATPLCPPISRPMLSPQRQQPQQRSPNTMRNSMAMSASMGRSLSPMRMSFSARVQSAQAGRAQSPIISMHRDCRSPTVPITSTLSAGAVATTLNPMQAPRSPSPAPRPRSVSPVRTTRASDPFFLWRATLGKA